MVQYEVIVLFLAGLGAGVVTGLMSLSAAIVAAPILIIFLGYNPAVAIGISLASDFFASSVTAYNFHKHDNIRIKPALLVLLFAVGGAFLGSYYSHIFNQELLSKFIGGFVIFGGFHLVRRGAKKPNKFFKKDEVNIRKKFIRFLFLSFVGFGVGIFAGVFGMGGGITLLYLLTVFLGYRIHGAIGTAVFVMAFISLSGAVGHFVYGVFSPFAVVVASLGGIIGAFFSSRYANKMPEEKLVKVTGSLILLLGIFLVVQQFFF